MKDLWNKYKSNKKVWIAVAIIIVVVAWALISGSPAPEVAQ